MTLQQRTVWRFETGWKFRRGSARNAHRPGKKDAHWRKLRLPHDWSIEQPFDETAAVSLHGGYLPGGIGWYRKSFSLPKRCRNKRVILDFDGVYQHASVWLNGHHLADHPYGYTAFHVDLTEHLRFDRPNVLAVKVDNSRCPNCRWYSGSGIFRHVWLTVTDPVHVAHWGVCVTTPDVAEEEATLRLTTTVCNDTERTREVQLVSRIVDPSGTEVAQEGTQSTLAPRSSQDVVQEVRVLNPWLWDVESPHLYEVRTELAADEDVVDDCRTVFGIRTCRFDPDEGFILNGTPRKLKGVNLHHDNGCLGAAAFDRAEQRRVERVKSLGANAVRTSHNPPSREFLDACDRLGILVVDEAFDEWAVPKLRYGYAEVFHDWWREDLRSMVWRDRNHPCVVLWSVGNEVPEQATAEGAERVRMLADFVRELDPTRPVGYGARPDPWPTPEFWAPLDVCGYNYRSDLYADTADGAQRRSIIGSETFAYHAFETWTAALNTERVAGEFIWTGMDYIGESGLGRVMDEQKFFPVHTSMCGELDCCGFKKPRSFYRDILWDNDPQLYVAVHCPMAPGKGLNVSPWGWPSVKASWTYPGMEGRDLRVDVYSPFDSVELVLNGQSVGTNTTSRANRHLATWIVPYQPGTLRAIGYRQGRKVAETNIRTAGAPARVRLVPDRNAIKADGRDLCFVAAEVCDEDGMVHPNADSELRFSATGAARLLAVGSADPENLQPFGVRRMRVFHGRCLCVVRAKNRAGKAEIRAAAPGLAPATTVLCCE